MSNNLRVEERKSLFVQATLHFMDGFCSVKVRNISPAGALVEAERLPRSGTPVEIRRGPLTAMGTVIWKRGGKAGIEFLAETDVKRWMPNLSPQAMVDNAFQVFKGAPASAFVAHRQMSDITTDDIDAVADLLDELASTFAGDAGLVYNYSTKLHALDVASQMLRKLAIQARFRQS